LKIKLSPEECHLAAIVASTRMTSSSIKGHKDILYEKSWLDGFMIHLYGCFGEIAASKALEIPWPAWVDRFKATADLGTNIEVRHRIKDEHDLIIRKDDDPSRFYVLTTGNPDSITVHGYVVGKHGKDKRFLANHGGKMESFFVQKEFLKPIEILKDIVRTIKV
jgi:hypothetical protein